MTAVRLNDSHRSFLYTLAKERVRCPAEEMADKTTYALAAKLVKAGVESQYPSRDMKVLQKYNAAEQAISVRLQLTAGGVEQFEFRGDKSGPLAPSNRRFNHVYPTTKAMSEAVSAHLLAAAALKKARETKLADYKSLIYSSTNLAQVEAVWPLASELRPRVGRMLPVTLSNEVIARIKADAITMKRAA